MWSPNFIITASDKTNYSVSIDLFYFFFSSLSRQTQQHHHKKTVPEYWLRVAAELGLFVAIASLVLVYTFSYFNLSAMCFSDTATANKEIYLGKDMEALRNLLCPVLKLINHHVSMSK
ncbi:hypothetical protein AAHE18_04G188100 [Arachis hypogaea]